MRRLIFGFIALFYASLMMAQGTPDFAGSQWIGAITRADAHIPEGRTFTGEKLSDPSVKAAWAASDTLSRRSIILRKTFNARKKVTKATACVCGLGFYEMSMNGKQVNDAMFAPLWSDYDKSVFYNSIDVTSMIKRGENTIDVLLGNGFYNEQGGRYAKLLVSFGPPTLLFRMQVEYSDGSEDIIVSDGSWHYAPSCITFNSIYGGEDCDARIAPAWRNVVIQNAPKGKLRPQMAQPVKIMETFGVQKRHNLTDEEVISASKSMKREVSKGAFVLDMGQNLAGFPQITVSGKAGQKVMLTVSETLTDGGACNQKQTGRPHYYIYTLKGGAQETWHPHFSYYGFRYIQVEGAVMKGDDNPQHKPEINDIHSCFVYNSARKIYTFECSNPLINDTYRLFDRAVRSNMQSVFTDCPHREKLGWLEQDWLNGEGLIYSYDLRNYLKQELQVIADAQHANGAVPTTAPEFTLFKGKWLDPFSESPEWGGSIIALPFLYLQHYGDDSLIKTYYPQMLRYVDYLATQDSALILKQGLGDWYDYGDYRAGFPHHTSIAFVSTSHYYQWTKMMESAARLTGHEADENRLRMHADSIKAAINATFYHKDTHQYDSGSQTANAIALYMNLVDSADRAQVMNNLIADIHSHGDRLTTGDIGNRYLFYVLEQNSQRELLYKMLNHYDTPGYGYQIKKGMTTLTEQWNPEKGSSMNHFMMGHIMNIIIPSLVGINVNGKLLKVAPHPVGDIKWCNGSTECAYGRISCSWKKSADTFSMQVEVPDGATISATMPYSNKEYILKKGLHKLEEKIR
jgi:alpha-L-rhamnosidase